MATQSPSWQTTSDGRIYDPGEGPVVYFDPRSGDTHLLTDFSAAVVSMLNRQAMTPQQLEQALAPQVDESNPGELARFIGQVLDELAALDIVTGQ